LLSGISAIDTGQNHACALTGAGGVVCWGIGTRGSLGDGLSSNNPTPVTVLQARDGAPLTGVLEIAAGADQSCARMSDRTVRCWGANDAGKLGNGNATDQPTPVPVVMSPGGPPLGAVSRIATGADHTCALAEDGVYCWGANDSGQLGNGTTNMSSVPVAVQLTCP
jgi:hypothetical protein